MVSSAEEVEVDAETAAAIERGIRAADQGRVVPNDEVRKLVPSGFPSFLHGPSVSRPGSSAGS